MRRIATLASALAILALAARASAGGYVGVGLGPGAGVHGQISEHFSGDGGSAGRLALGQRMGPFALEASLFGSQLQGVSALTAGNTDYSSVSLGVDGKLYLPVAARLEAYLRAGLNKTWVVASGEADIGYSGTGTSLGGGVQFNFSPIPIVQASVFLDYGRQFLTLHDAGHPTLDGEIGMLTLGVAVGTSF